MYDHDYDYELKKTQSSFVYDQLPGSRMFAQSWLSVFYCETTSMMRAQTNYIRRRAQLHEADNKASMSIPHHYI